MDWTSDYDEQDAQIDMDANEKANEEYVWTSADREESLRYLAIGPMMADDAENAEKMPAKKVA